MDYDDYLAKNLDNNINYSEYIAENLNLVNANIAYSEYIAEQIDYNGEDRLAREKQELRLKKLKRIIGDE